MSNRASSTPWMPRLVTFVIWALLAVTAAYWALGARQVALPTALPVVAPPAQADSAAVARLLGQRGAPVAALPSAPPASNRFKLIGVLARGKQGAALISVDGKPAQPYQVGSEVDAGLVLQSVTARSATLGSTGGATSAASSTLLELPLLEKGGLDFGQTP